MKRNPALLLAFLTLALTGTATAQTTYPDKPIRLIAGFPPGTVADISARVVGQKLSEAWGKPVVVDNIAGAAGNIATDRAAKAAPDGYTLIMAGSAAMVLNPSLYEKLPYDPIKDFSPVSQVCYTANILVLHNGVPAKSVQELVALARAQPGKLTFASAGNGSIQQIAGELLKTMSGIDIRHVPYKGSTAFMPDLLAGRVTMAFGNTSTVLSAIREGKLRALAVTSMTRSPLLPDLPTMAESGYPGFEATIWFGVLAPARTPAPIIDKLHREIARILALPDVRTKFADLGMEPIGNSPDEFSRIIKAEIPKWAKVIKESGMKPE